MFTSTCKNCGARLMWAITPGGKKIPLSMDFPVYPLEGTYDATGLARVEKPGNDLAMICHWDVCKPDPQPAPAVAKKQPEVSRQGKEAASGELAL